MSDPVIYTAVLPVPRETVEYVSALLYRRRRDVGTRTGRRALTCWWQAVLACRWFYDGTRVDQLATDTGIALRTAYRYLHEAIDVLAGQAPSLHGALLAARTAGHSHVGIDGTVIATDRCRVPGPTRGVDLWWSGKHHHHGGNVQVITAPDGWPLWTSPVRPGREHDTTAARTHDGLLTALDEWTDTDHVVLADLGFEGERDQLTCPIKKTKGVTLTVDQQTVNALHSATRALAERGNALLKHFRALRHVTLCPWRIGAITAAALVLLHQDHNRTTWPKVTIMILLTKAL